MPRQIDQQLIYQMISGIKLVVFLLAFLDLVGINGIRTAWGYSKTQLNEDVGVSLPFLGFIDSLFLISIFCGMIVLGSQIHRFTIRQYSIGGLFLSVSATSIFSLVWVAGGFFNQWFMAVCISVGAFFRATCWPGVMNIFGRWFGNDSNKGTIMAILSVSLNFAGFYSSYCCNMLENAGFGFAANLIVTGGVAMVVVILMYFYLPEKPEDVWEGQRSQNSVVNLKSDENEGKPSETVSEPFKKYGIFAALLLPKVPAYLLVFCLAKACTFALIFWGPTYLTTRGQLISTQRGYIFAMYDVGSGPGSLLLGAITDRTTKRGLVYGPLMVVCTLALFLVTFASEQQPFQFYLIFFILGLTVGSVYNVLATVTIADLAGQNSQKGLIGKISSLFEGVSNVYCTVILNIIPRIPFSWLFYLTALQSLVGTVIIGRFVVEELSQKVEPLLSDQSVQMQQMKSSKDLNKVKE